MMRSVRFSVAIVSAMIAGSFLASGPVEAQVVKPFKIKGAGSGPTGIPLPGQEPRMHWAIGEGTHLGRYDGEGSVQTLNIEVFEPVIGGKIAGQFGSGQPFVFRGANGDLLACDYGVQGHGERGTYELTVLDILGMLPDGTPILLVKAIWIADFVVKPEQSTGKFAGATGSWVMYADSDPFVLGTSDPVGYRWEGEGRLTFVKGR
jgi:hypothetical protein